MGKAKLGEWRWYCGMEEDDDEMAECGTRDDAILFGCRSMRPLDHFWIVEARMFALDERQMAAGTRDTAPFAESRNGEWIKAGPHDLTPATKDTSK
jgi:hypothetical protein